MSSGQQQSVNYFSKDSKRISRQDFLTGRQAHYIQKLQSKQQQQQSKRQSKSQSKQQSKPKRKRIRKGTLLYLGTGETTEIFPKHFIYGGMLDKEGQTLNIIYTSTSELNGEGYARCVGQNRGWVKKFVAKKDFFLVDETEEQLFYQANEIKDEGFCEKGTTGYYVLWSGTVDEIVICHPERVLDFVGAKRCLGHGKFSKYYA